MSTTDRAAVCRQKAPSIMAQLQRDFHIDIEDAAAIAGNLGYESACFTQLQEIKPAVKGSKGGYGWAQWTGPRRREYEAYCKRNGLNPASDKANYAWLFLELKGPERRAIDAVHAAKGLEAKVEAFERAYERAGVKNYQQRNRWAREALDAYYATGPLVMPSPAPVPTLRPADKSVIKSKRFWTWLLAGLGTPVAALSNLDWRAQMLIVALVSGAATYAIATMPQVRDRFSQLLRTPFIDEDDA